MAVSEDAPATDAATAPDSALTLPEPEPALATVPQVTATNSPSPTPAPREKGQPEFRLSGIIYSVARPCAIVNRETVFLGDQVSGATVVGINRTQVTLQINGQRKTLALQ
jgi:type II secretory pathway component PulC